MVTLSKAVKEPFKCKHKNAKLTSWQSCAASTQSFKWRKMFSLSSQVSSLRHLSRDEHTLPYYPISTSLVTAGSLPSSQSLSDSLSMYKYALHLHRSIWIAYKPLLCCNQTHVAIFVYFMLFSLLSRVYGVIQITRQITCVIKICGWLSLTTFSIFVCEDRLLILTQQHHCQCGCQCHIHTFENWMLSIRVSWRWIKHHGEKEINR